MSVAATPDLWPDDLDLDPTVSAPTPVAILRQQGHLLGRRTGNVVYGEVESHTDLDGDADVEEPTRFHHRLVLVSAYLGYRHRIVEISHLSGLYPVRAVSYHTRAAEQPVESAELLTVADLRSFLQRTFNRPDIKRVIRAILRQTQDFDADDE